VAAPAPAAPVQTVARTYLVIFDWNRADLTDRARQIIADAAAARTTARSTRIEVSGHADCSDATGKTGQSIATDVADRAEVSGASGVAGRAVGSWTSGHA
jgi:hypothetical protein